MLSLDSPLMLTEQRQFLRLRLADHTLALLAIEQVNEVVQVEYARVIPIPEMPSQVLGVYGWRGEVLWVVDLGSWLGLKGDTARELTVVVLEQGPQKLGLVVLEVEDIFTTTLSQMQPLAGMNYPPALIRAAKGCWVEEEGVLVWLDGERLLTGNL